MLLSLWIIPTVCAVAVYSAPRANEDDQTELSVPSVNTWAVLVAGSHKWIRYRHQANVCHAYKLLRKNGFPKNRIITFMYDDIAFNEKNPEPGVIRNEPGGENVYEGVPIDYSGENVNKDVYLKVLNGYKTKLHGIGSGRVVASTKNENILIFHTGLGGEDAFVEFPDSGRDTLLYAKEFATHLKHMHNRNTYKNMLLVLESSHSGAMFENETLPHNLNVMAMTAGGPDEDTYGTWCSDKFPCLAGLFAYSWLNHAENASKDLSVFNLYDAVRNAVANTGLEHPQIYGDWKIGTLPLIDFIGHSKNNNLLNNKSGIRVLHNAVSKTTYDTSVKDSVIVDSTKNMTINSQNEIISMQTKLYNIVKLVVPNEQIRSAMLKQQPITKTFFQNKCFDDLLSLFYEKCTVQKNSLPTSQENLNVLKQLCDATVIHIQQMSATEAIKKICI